jgi:hypothetical protein
VADLEMKIVGTPTQQAPTTETLFWRPRCIKIQDWPAFDRELLEQDCATDDLLASGGHGAKLRADSVRKVIKGYGAWLSFLLARGWLDASQHPANRVTRERLAAYFKAMRALERRGYSILGRFIELRMAMMIMAPGRDTRFILRPNGTSIRKLLQPHSRPLLVPDSAVLYDWGIKMMEEANLNAPRRHGLVAFRDGLLIAMLASRGRRLRSMSLLRLGQELKSHGEGFRIELQPDQVKTGQYDAFMLPAHLTPFILRYIKEVRPALLGSNVHDAFWIGINGEPLLAKGIQQAICARSKVRFGVTFGPHRFRHAIATTAPLRAPEKPGLAAACLGISKGVAEASYNRANQVVAVQTYASIIGALNWSESPRKSIRAP